MQQFNVIRQYIDANLKITTEELPSRPNSRHLLLFLMGHALARFNRLIDLIIL